MSPMPALVLRTIILAIATIGLLALGNHAFAHYHTAREPEFNVMVGVFLVIVGLVTFTGLFAALAELFARLLQIPPTSITF